MINQISVDDYQKLRTDKKEIILIDVREEWEHKIVNFEEAKLISLNTLSENIQSLDKSKQYVIHCHHGVRSLQACLFLKNKGFNNVSNLKGGIDAMSEIDSKFKKY